MPYVYNALLDAGLDQTGSGGAATTPGGSTTQIQYNNAGTFGGVSTMTFDGTNVTLAGRLINSYNGTASSPAKVLTGTWFTGGTSTTTKPQLLIEPSGTTSTAWSTSGTGLGVNAASGFTGSLLDLQVNGTRKIAAFSNGNVGTQSSYGFGILDVGANLYAGVRASGAWLCEFSDGGFAVKSNSYIGFGSSPTPSGYAGWPDTLLFRDAAGVVAQRAGTAAQAFRLYNTFTDNSNYERLSTTWSSNVCYTKAENAGTGSARLYVPVTGATTVASLPSASTAGAGARAFVTDASATTFLSTVSGGGANKVPVVSDGTNWLIG
jgi:hypothetical protein